MKHEKKTIAIILVATVGLSLFIGLASAAGRNDPISQILEIVLGIDTKVNDVQTDLGKTTMMLGSYSGSFESPTPGTGNVIEITSSKPAIYTVTVHLWLKDAGDQVSPNHAPVKWTWAATNFFGQQVAAAPVEADRTFTLAGYGVALAYNDVGPGNLWVAYSIVVQGEKGTEVKIGEW